MNDRPSARPRNGAGRKQALDRGPAPGEARMYTDLIRAIHDQRLRPGMRLNEAQLAKAYGLARPRVRRVLIRLAGDGIIEFHLNLGAFIRRPAPDEARNVYQARRFLEAGVVQTIAKNPSGASLEHLRAFVAREKKAWQRPKPGVHHLSNEFHIVLAEASRNQVVKEMLAPLIHRCCLIQSLYLTPAGAPCLVHDHEELIHHLTNGNAREALRVHNRHFDHLESSLMLPANDGTGREGASNVSALENWTTDSGSVFS